MNSNPGMNYALWADRVLAALIDAGIALLFMIVLYIVIFVLSFIVTMIGGAIESGTGTGVGGMLGALGSCGGCFFFLVVPPLSYLIIGLLNKVYWVAKRGCSIGQGMMRIRVVDANGHLLSMGQATLRLLCTVGIGFIPFGGLIDILWPLFDDPTRQTLHDKAVGSFAIKVDDPAPPLW